MAIDKKKERGNFIIINLNLITRADCLVFIKLIEKVKII